MAISSYHRGINNLPSPPLDRLVVSIQEDTVCKGESAQLTVSSNQEILVSWFRNGTWLSDGDTFLTSPLDTYTKFQARIHAKDSSYFIWKEVGAYVVQTDNIEIVAEPSEVGLPGGKVQFQLNSPIKARSVFWNFGDGDTSNLPLPEHLYQFPGTYEVHLRLTYGDNCVVDETITIEVLDEPFLSFPSTFSPNEDGFNDIFQIDYSGIEKIELKIYTRSGQMVYVTENPDFKWNGISILGQPVPQGIYVCRVWAETRRGEILEEKHTLTLIR